MISCVVPHYPITPDHDKALKRCVNSIRGADEKIIVVNKGMGFGPASNLGVSLAKGDFIAIINNDIICDDWPMHVLTEPNAVTFPIVNNQIQEFSGAFLVFPRWIIDELGGQVYDERFQIGYWEDVDLWTRLKELNIPFFQKPFHVSHPEPGMTMKFMPSDTDFVNRQIYLEKWGSLPLKGWV